MLFSKKTRETTEKFYTNRIKQVKRQSTNIHGLCTRVNPEVGAKDTTVNKNRDPGCI